MGLRYKTTERGKGGDPKTGRRGQGLYVSRELFFILYEYKERKIISTYILNKKVVEWDEFLSKC